MYSSLLPVNSTLITIPSTNTQPISQRAINTRTKVFRVSCNAAPDDKNDIKFIIPEPQKFVFPNVDRRNLLMGLGSLYTASNVISLPEAVADTIKTPDITSKCEPEVSSGFIYPNQTIRPKTCCPPNLGIKEINNFKFPTENTVRMRWPAHKGTQEQVDKYRRAIQAMRDLDRDEDNPHSFKNQAKIHCAYCHGGYTQHVKVVKNGKEEHQKFVIQIHNSWLFFPFHRWYLYFYERILGNLIKDPTFALPYWKWDDPEGMQIPNIFTEDIIFEGKPNTLKQDVNRDLFHLPPEIVDLNWDGRERARSDEQQIACNLSKVYQDLVSNGCDPLSFFGGKYVAEAIDKNAEKIPVATSSVGSVEGGTHTAVHRWVGNRNLRNNEDMGLFYSAGYDPLFYCHHANVDRMWKLWKDLRPENVEPNDPDWLDASYVFYDENKELVRVSNRDSVCLKGLGYNYIEDSKEVFPWRKSRPAKRNLVDQIGEDKGIKTVEETTFPLSLEMTKKVRVKRPAVQKTEEEKANMPNEVLLIEGIKFDCSKFVKFDVFVNDKLRKDIVATTCGPEYAGGFAQIPHGDVKKSAMSSCARFGLKELLQNTNTEGEEYARVILVPRAGCEDLTIGKISIIYP